MLTIAISLLFGTIAVPAFAQVFCSVRQGMSRGRVILAELGRIDAASQTVVRFATPRSVAANWQPLLAAA